MAKRRTEDEIVEAPVAKKAFSIERVEKGWSFVTYTLVNDKVTEVKRTEPDIKAIVLEQFKIAAFKYWTEIG